MLCMGEKMVRTTNFVKATYTEIIDLQTVNGKTSIIGIHTPTGSGPYNKLRGLFTQFRKYKYGGIQSMVMAPAANLPVDPLGLTGVQGTTDLMDPRDTLNPILFHGCHGQSMSTVINTLFAKHSNPSVQEQLMNPTVGFESQSADKIDLAHEFETGISGSEESYYRFLTDPKWRKFGTQSLLRLKNLYPLTWRVASTLPYLPTRSTPNAGVIGGDNSTDPVAVPSFSDVINIQPNVPAGTSDPTTLTLARASMQQFTNGVSRLGWLPTTAVSAKAPIGEGDYSPYLSSVVRLPKLFMGVLVLPPAYNVEQFFRLSIRHRFYFKDFTQSLAPLYDSLGDYLETGGSLDEEGRKSYFNWIDYTEAGSKTVAVSEIDNGTTLDVVDGESRVVSDAAM